MTKEENCKYRKTPIGKVPADWEVIKTGKYIDVFSGYGFKSKNFTERQEGAIPLIKIGNLQNGKVIVDNVTSFLPKDFYDEYEDYQITEGDVLIALSGATTGKIGVAKREIRKALLNQRVGKFKVINDSKISNKYFLFLSQSKYINTPIYKYIGKSAQGNLSPSDIKRIRIPLPPLPEQQKIAEILGTVDEAIEKVDKAIEKTERLKKGLIRELFTKGIGHKEFKDTKIGKIPREWEVLKLEEIGDIYDKERIPLSEMERANRKGVYPYCGANGILDYIDDYIFEGEFILLAEDGGSYGKFDNSCYMMNGKFWVNNHAHIIKVKENKSTNRFLLYMLNFLDLRPYVVGSTRVKLNQEYLRQINVFYPPLPEQQKIAEILSTVDKKIEMEKKRKEKLKRIKKGLMQDLLTGKKRVKV